MPKTQNKNVGRPATRDHLLSGKKPATKKLQIILDPEAYEAYEEAQALLSEATAENRTEREEALEAAKERLSDAVVTMKFQSVGRKRYDEIIDAHPATEEQKAQAKKQGIEETPSYNLETFPPALVAASLVEPDLTLEDVQELYDTWNNAEVMELFLAALEVNTIRRTGDLGNVFGPTRN